MTLSIGVTASSMGRRYGRALGDGFPSPCQNLGGLRLGREIQMRGHVVVQVPLGPERRVLLPRPAGFDARNARRREARALAARTCEACGEPSTPTHATRAIARAAAAQPPPRARAARAAALAHPGGVSGFAAAVSNNRCGQSHAGGRRISILDRAFWFLGQRSTVVTWGSGPLPWELQHSLTADLHAAFAAPMPRATRPAPSSPSASPHASRRSRSSRAARRSACP